MTRYSQFRRWSHRGREYSAFPGWPIAQWPLWCKGQDKGSGKTLLCPAGPRFILAIKYLFKKRKLNYTTDKSHSLEWHLQ